MRTSQALVALFVVGGLVAGGLVWAPWKRSTVADAGTPTASTATSSAKVGKSGSGSSVRVTAVKIEPQHLAEKISATGTLRAEEGVELLSEINGKIIEVAFKEGGRVKKGDLLVRLNDADLRAQVVRAVFHRELAEIKERRLSKLLESKSVKQEDYDAAVSDLNVQRAEVALAEATVAKTEIRAPFDGVIGLRFVSEGAFVNATSRIATLQSLDRVKVDFSVPEKYGPRIRNGTTISFTVAGLEKKYTGEIYASDPKVDSATRTVLLRAICPNNDGQLLPGTFANVEFTLSEIEDAILVPSMAVVPGVTEKYVFVVQDGKAVRKNVQVGTRTETAVQILEGLTPGDLVITSGIQQLRGGLAVTVFEATGEKIAAATVKSPATTGKKKAKETVDGSR